VIRLTAAPAGPLLRDLAQMEAQGGSRRVHSVIKLVYENLVRHGGDFRGRRRSTFPRQFWACDASRSAIGVAAALQQGPVGNLSS
jgi:hypothetical protein